jgi:hypothetical protein
MDRWKHEREYIQLLLAINHAQREGNSVLYEQLQERIKVLDRMRWHSKTEVFIELAPYQTLVEALEQTATRLRITFPDLAAEHNQTGDGQFIFGVSDGVRTVQIWPMESRGHYDIEVYALGVCYRGQTTSLDEATIALSRWFVERCLIEALHAQFPWMSRDPLQLTGPRMTLK